MQIVQGTKILTESGYKNIEEIQIGENLITHDEKYVSVKNNKKTKKETIYQIKLFGLLPLECIKEQVFYTRKVLIEDALLNKYLKNLSDDYFLGSPIYTNINHSFNLTIEDARLMGIYFRIKNQEILNEKLLQLNLNKDILPTFLLNFSKELLESFLLSYINQEKMSVKFCINTQTKENSLIICMIIHKLYKIGCRIFIDKFTGQYCVVGTNVLNFFIKDNMIWYRIQDISKEKEKKYIYELTLENSYHCIVNGVLL